MKPQVEFVNPRGLAVPRGLSGGLYAYGSVGAFRAAAPLPKNTQELIDQAVVRVGRQRLVIAADLIASGLTYSLPNWLAVPTLYSEKIGEAGTAQRGMSPKAGGERQIMDRTGTTIPIYCTWDDFSFNIRELMAAERVGAPLDTTHVEQATRNVNEAIEDAVLNGGLQAGGFTSPGLLSTTNTQTFVDNEAWTASTHSGQDILQDVLNMIDVAQADGFYGPFTLYYPTLYSAKLSQNFSDGVTTFETSILNRLKQIEVEGGTLGLKVADKLPADTVLLVQKTSNVCDVIVGQTPTTVSWQDAPGWERNFVVLACVVPRFRSDYNSNYGVVKGTKT